MLVCCAVLGLLCCVVSAHGVGVAGYRTPIWGMLLHIKKGMGYAKGLILKKLEKSFDIIILYW